MWKVRLPWTRLLVAIVIAMLILFFTVQLLNYVSPLEGPLARLVKPFPGLFPLMFGWALLAVVTVAVLFYTSLRFAPQRLSLVYIRSEREEQGATPLEKGAYTFRQHAAVRAREFWEYAYLASYVYRESTGEKTEEEKRKKRHWDRAWDSLQAAGWTSLGEMRHADSGFYGEMFVKEGSQRRKPIIAVAFRGTDEKRDLFSWAGTSSWVTDQYSTLKRTFVGPAREGVLSYLEGRKSEDCELVAVGHSLGGGLAQCFAYAWAKLDNPPAVKVSRVFAFDTTPVSGYLKDELRDSEVYKDLRIESIFEHGEILAVARLFLFFNRRKHPNKIQTYRFNLSKSRSFVASHGMASLADGLARVKDEEPPRKLHQRSERLTQLEMIYDYIKFHIGLYLATPAVLIVLADGLGVTTSVEFAASLFVMAGLYLLAGAHAARFMGNHVNSRWSTDHLEEFDAKAFDPLRRFLHHWIYWAGILVGLSGILVSKVMKGSEVASAAILGS